MCEVDVWLLQVSMNKAYVRFVVDVVFSKPRTISTPSHWPLPTCGFCALVLSPHDNEGACMSGLASMCVLRLAAPYCVDVKSLHAITLPCQSRLTAISDLQVKRDSVHNTLTTTVCVHR